MAVNYQFYIQNGRFVIPNSNIDYLYSASESTVPRIAETADSTVKIVGRDGDLTLDTTYNPLEFKLVVYTDENLTFEEKEAEIIKVVNFLNSIKKTNKNFAFVDEALMYSLKYAGQLSITKFPKSVRFEIPLKSNKAFATKLTSTTITGAGSKSSTTIENTGCVITINGPCTNPVVSLNNYQMSYTGSVLSGNKLVIDTGNSTITHITSLGVETNAAANYNHEYPKIKNGTNTVAIVSGISTASNVTTTWYDLKL